jgi:hypothetical protein
MAWLDNALVFSLSTGFLTIREIFADAPSYTAGYGLKAYLIYSGHSARGSSKPTDRTKIERSRSLRLDSSTTLRIWI